MNWSISRGAVGALSMLATFSATAAPTSITLDGSFGHTGAISPTSPGLYQIAPATGKSVGSNLFQSFGVFNLGTGDTANFMANAGTQNVIARVTGGSASNIDGTIESATNLCFINPAGIMFTANASLNINGAFVASTANCVKFSDGTFFYADTQHPINDAGLSSAPISAFGFTSPSPAPISFSGTQLINPGGIHVIGGDITLDGATLFAPGGNLTLFSAASAGEVPFSLASAGAGFGSASNTNYGNITLQNRSELLTGGGVAGHVVIRGGQLLVKDDSSIRSINTGPGTPADVSVQAVSLTFQGGGNITTQALGAGDGANIFVQAGTVSLDGADPSGNPSQIFTTASSTGNAGTINLAASGAISLTNGGQVTTSTTGSAGGNIVISSASLSVDGVSLAGNVSSIITFGGVGATSGSVQVTTGPLTLTNGGQIDTVTNFNGGEIFITASALTADGDSVLGDASSGVNTFATGIAISGAIHVAVAGALDLTNGATITSLPGAGGAGTISVTAGTLEIAGAGPLGNDAGIYSSTYSQNPAGTINLVVSGATTISDGGTINTASFAGGSAGSVTLQAGSLAIDGFDQYGDDSGIYSGANAASSAGDGGTVSLAVTGAMSLTNGGTIDASTQGTGDGGDILISCGSLGLDGFDANGFTSGIASLAVSSGTGGNVTIDVAHAASLTNGGGISAGGSGSGAGGDILFTAGQLSIDGAASDNIDSEISSASIGSGGGGRVDVVVSGAMSLTNGGQVDANAVTGGNAGSVQVRAGQLSISGSDSILQDSSISSRAKYQGNSGVIDVSVAGGLSIAGGGQITAASYGSGNAGSVTVQAGDLRIAGTDTGGSSSAISSSASGSGNGGQINITASGAVDLANHGLIAAFSDEANAGDIRMRANNLTLTNGGEIGTVAANNGGSIDLTIGQIVYLYRSMISASAGNAGGNITIDPELVVLDDSQITAFGGVSNGNITIDTNYFLAQDSPVTATGVVTISVPNLDLSGSLLPLPETLESDENKLKENCARSIKHEFSSFIVVGRGGTESAPEELQPDFGL